MYLDQPILPIKALVRRNKKKTWHRLSGRGHFSCALLFFGPLLAVSLLVLNPFTATLNFPLPFLEVKPALADDGHPMENTHPSSGTLTPTVMPDSHQHSSSNSSHQMDMGDMDMNGMDMGNGQAATPDANSASHSSSHGFGSAETLSPVIRDLILAGFAGFNASVILVAGLNKRKNAKKAKVRLIHR